MRTASPWMLMVIASAALSCAEQEFDPSSRVESVRILATRAEPPYAAPGISVKLDALAVDARPTRLRPMVVAWLPAPCVNPASDSYFECYPAFEQSFRQGVDVTPQFSLGTSFSFTMPADAIAGHPATSGIADPYGTAFVFVVACAGHIQYLGYNRGDPAALPFGCFDEGGQRLGADDSVFGYAQVFSFQSRTNANPVIDHLTLDDVPIDSAIGISMPHCTEGDVKKCPTQKIDTVVDPSNQEVDPNNTDSNGSSLKEAIWVDYFATAGKAKHDIVSIYDPKTGRVGGSGDDFSSSQTPGAFQFWAVLHDNRGGVSWLQVPFAAP